MINIFNEANELKEFNVSINDTFIIPDTILTAEIVYKNNTPVVTGSIIINDLYDIRSFITWEDSVIKFEFLDIFDGFCSKTFKIIKFVDVEHAAHRKAIEIYFQDEFSYALDNSFLSKSFNNTITHAFNQYIDQLGFSEIQKEITEITETRYFSVPKNISNLDFFLGEFKKYGYVFYQTRDGLFVKSQEDIDVANLDNNGVFTNQTDNQYYQNLIHDINLLNNNRNMIVPKTRSIAYDKDNKKVSIYDFNDKSRYSLNADSADIQNTFGFRDMCQQDLNFGNHDMMIRDSFMKQYHLEMVVNGYAKNNVYQIYDLILRGNAAVSDTDFAGTYEGGGKYISSKVVDKIVNNKLIQKIDLERADKPEKII